MRKKLNKKSQHEIAGFVLIVLIVSIIGVIFLSLTIGRGEFNKQTSIEISNLLGASMYHTTDCAINYVPQYRELQDLVKECYKDKSGNYRECLGGRNVCEVLEYEFKNIIDKGLEVSDESPNKAYKLDIYYSYDDDANAREEILSFENGNFENCSSVVGGNQPTPVSSFGSGKIEIDLMVCKG